MQLDEAPCFSNRRVEFPPSVTSCLRDERDDVSPLLGGILSDSKLAWLSKGPLLEIVDTSDGSKLAAWTFGAVVRDFKTKITCVVELPHVASAGYRCQVDQLLIGLECELTGGMLCIFNIAGSRVVRAINLPSKVTAIDVVSLGGKLSHSLHKGLHDMVGIAVVGTNDGQILLVDLRRDLSDAALLSGHVNHWDGLHDELHPCELFSLEQGNFDLWEESKDKHMCLHLNERDFMKHQRLLVHFSSAMRNSFLPDDPSVTSVLYVPQLASVCVGFAFGSFQIWSLQTLSHVYTFPAQELQPVVQLSFQEACDDPNASCYLWAIRGGLGRDKSYSDLSSPVSVFGPPSATMYSLCFDEKVQLPDHCYLYQNFLMCSTVFEHDLSGDKDTVGGRLVTLSPVNRGMPVSLSGQPPPEDSSALGHSSNAISLCLIVWETWGPTGPTSTINPVNTHMVLFDINQWYVDQMPGRLSVRGGLARQKSVASYLVSHDLQNVLSNSGGLLLGVHVNPCSLLQFYSVQNVEEFSKPSSLAFGSIALMERQVVHLKHPGVQRAFLSSLVSSGPGALMTPTNLFHECLVLGLRPLLMDVSTTVNVPLDEQRTYVLCVALEQRLARFVWRCAQEWADGRLAAAGCTLSWLLSVAWNRAAVLKQLAIRLCAQLFDHSGEKLDSNAQRQLHHIVGVFHNLEILFENVVQNKWHLSLNEWPQVNLQNDALKLECQYYDVLQWFIDVELLPEGLNPTIPYPAQEIAVIYQTRRLELQHLFDQQGKDKEIKDFLMIDALLKNQPGGANVSLEWERDAGGSAGLGAGLYPPASLQALLRTFLVKDVALEVKHSIVIYVLMDLADMLDSTQYFTALQNFMKFPAAFGISPGSMRLTQAFWYLDHKTFDTALDMLLDPLVSVGDIDLWQHRCIIRLLTAQGQTSLALRYIRARRPLLQEPSDISLHLYLLIANNLIDEAFVYQRNHRTEENSKILLSEFFQGCEERNHLKTVLQFSLDEGEESAFSRYLETSRHPAADDLRVLYLLKRSRYVEALEVQQDLKRKGRSGSTRDVVVNGFFKTLPSVTRKLAAHCAQQHNKLKSWSQVEKPSPLFVNPKIVSPRMRYQSSLIEAAVEKSRETWNRLVDRIPPVTSEIESTPFLCTPRAKLFSFSRSSSDTNIQHQNLDRKRPREDDVNDCSSDSRFKRSRFQKLETALAELQQQQQQDQHKQTRLSTYSCTDTLQLLHTPVVQRRSPSSRAKLQEQLLAFSPGHSKVTPQSIIKVRQRSGESISNSQNRNRVSVNKQTNEPELTEEESESEVFSKSTQPSKGESETDSEPGDKEEDEGPVLAGARRIIDFDSDVSSSDLSLSQSSFDSNSMHSQNVSVPKSPAFNPSSEKSLSKMVVLSEARKIGKPSHNVTFGKGSICVYDQDEPVDSEVAVQDESSNDTVDQEPSKDEESEANICIDKEKENCEKNPDKNSSFTLPSEPRLFRLDTSGIGTMNSEAIQSDLSATEDSEVFHSAESIVPTISSPSFRKSLARPSVKEIALGLYESKQDQVEPMKEKLAQLDQGLSNPITSQQSLSSSEYEMAEDEKLQESSVLALSSLKQADSSFRTLKRSPIKDYLPSVDVSESSSSIQKSGAASGLLQMSKHLSFTTNQEDSSTREEDETESKDGVEIVDLDEESNSITDQSENVKKDASCGMMYDEDSGEKEGYLTENSNIFGMSNIDSADSSSDQESELSASKEDIEDNLISEDSDPQIRDENSDSPSASDVDEEVDIDHMETSTSNAQRASFEGKFIVSKSKSSSENPIQDVQITEDISPDIEESCVALEQPSVVEVEQCIAVDKLEVLSHVAEICGTRDASVLEITDAALECGDAPQICDINAEESKGNTMESSDALLNQGCVGDFHSESNSLVLIDKQSLGSCDLLSKSHAQASSTLAHEDKIDLEQDDMPKLRLDSGTLETSPESMLNAGIVESPNLEHQETSPSKTILLDASGKLCDKSVDVLYEDLQVAAKESLQSNFKNLPTSSEVVGYTPASPSVKTPKRNEKIRTASTSSSKSEAYDEAISNRRVTRGMKQSTESLVSLDGSSGQVLHEPTPEEYQHVVGSPAKGQKRRRGSQSSKDGHVQNVPNLPRTRRGSESSVSSQVDDSKARSRVRTSSVSSQGSTAPNDKLSQAKLGKISEEDSASEESNVKATRGKQSKMSTSAKSPSSARSMVSSEAATSALGGQALTDDYESNRRLTRHQRSLLAKGVGIPSSSNLDLLSKDEEQDMDDDRMSQYSLRSSQRLREKHHGSPSSIASSVKERKGHFQTANPSSSKIDDYENTRRLTRHQRALLAKSMEISAVDCRDQPLLNEEDQQHSDDDAISLSSVRSSQRRKRKRQQSAVEGSPSSTASTVTNPALTPSSSRRRRQGRTEEVNRDVSPVSSIKRQRSTQTPGTPSSQANTPTRRSARLNALHSAQKSEDGDSQSVASLSPSSVTSGRRSISRRLSRQLSVSSEAPSEQFAFASPHVENPSASENAYGDVSLSEAFSFSPPKTLVTTGKTKSSSSEQSSTSKKSSRQTRANTLQTIKEESSTSKLSQEDTVLSSPDTRSSNRPSWHFIEPPDVSGKNQESEEPQHAKQVMVPSENQRGWHSAYQHRSKYLLNLPKASDSDSDESEEGSTQEEHVGRKQKPRK